MQIGPYPLENNVILAPMAGITDRPFREICKQHGAGLTITEMLASDASLRKHRKTRLKADHGGESGLHCVQIVGTDPLKMADAARYNAQNGAHIIDINMGCPAKKVCAVAAGSALLKNEALVRKILDAVVSAIDIPVTLKIRTGWDRQNRNAVQIAKIAEQSGIASLAVHGRTRACKFNGEAEYETIRQVKQSVNIPVIANGDINTPDKALWVLETTGADAIMIGRGAQGNPWLFAQVNQFLRFGKQLEKPSIKMVQKTLINHLERLYGFYGNTMGVNIARKHIGWYFSHLKPIADTVKKEINQVSEPSKQIALVNSVFTILTNESAAYGSL